MSIEDFLNFTSIKRGLVSDPCFVQCTPLAVFRTVKSSEATRYYKQHLCVLECSLQEDKLNSVLNSATAFFYDTKVTEINSNYR